MKKELKDMYIEFLANYYLLNKSFGYRHPLDIYSMFTYMLNNGYLSRKKTFKRIEKKVENTDHLPFTIFDGKGVCRNISSMLHNIYNIMELENDLTLVYSNPPEIVLDKLPGDPRGLREKEEIIKNYTYLEEQRKDLLNKLKEYKDEAYIRMIKLNENGGSFIYYLGNHVVNTVMKDGITYVLDPTNGYSLKQSTINPLYLLDKNNNPYHITTPFAKPDDVKKLMEKLKESITTYEEDHMRINEIKDYCDNNKELFESFYYSNKGLYKDISDELKEDNLIKRLRKKIKK